MIRAALLLAACASLGACGAIPAPTADTATREAVTALHRQFNAWPTVTATKALGAHDFAVCGYVRTGLSVDATPFAVKVRDGIADEPQMFEAASNVYCGEDAPA